MKRLLVALFVAYTVALFGQTSTKTPLSYYGLGDPSLSTSTTMSSMGHTNLAVVNATVVNFTNPASYTDIKRPTFNIDTKNEFLTLTNGAASQTSNAFSIQNFAFAFPIINDYKRFKRRAAFCFGVTPYTTMGYNLSYSETVGDLGQVDYLFFGKGGINSGYVGSAIDLLANKKRTNVLSVGANGHYVFGKLNKSRATQIAPSAGASNLYRQTNQEISDFDFSVGITYKHLDTLRVKRTRNDGSQYSESIPVLMSVAGFVRPSAQLQTFSQTIGFTFSDTVTNPNPIDTLYTSKSQDKTVTPTSFGVGVSVNIGNRWTLAADYVQTLWSQLQTEGKNAGLNNSNRVGVGIEFLPKTDIKDAEGKFFKTVRYRTGFNFEQTMYNSNGNRPVRYGVGLGMGFPLTSASLSNSMFNIGVEIARRQIAGSPLTENFFNVHVGFVITPHVYDQWFAKRKYD
jgi:hypothetical protein